MRIGHGARDLRYRAAHAARWGRDAPARGRASAAGRPPGRLRQRANDRLEQPHLCTEISFHDLRETHMKASGGIRRTACR